MASTIAWPYPYIGTPMLAIALFSSTKWIICVFIVIWKWKGNEGSCNEKSCPEGGGVIKMNRLRESERGLAPFHWGESSIGGHKLRCLNPDWERWAGPVRPERWASGHGTLPPCVCLLRSGCWFISWAMESGYQLVAPGVRVSLFMLVPGHFCFSCVFVVCSFMPTGLCACVSVNITLLPPVSQTNHLLTRAPAHPAQHHSNWDFTAAKQELRFRSHICLFCCVFCWAVDFTVVVYFCCGVYLPDVWGSIVELYQSRIGAVLFEIHKEETSTLIERGRSVCEQWKVPGWLLYGCLINEMILITDRMRMVGLFVSFTSCQWKCDGSFNCIQRV